jgi:predicted nucleotide-binding protein
LVAKASFTALSTEKPISARVFAVHGHNEAALQLAARFLEKLGLDAIILREQPDAGRTIIEKFVDCADDVGFAVVLLTPDDLAGPATELSQAARARQNVIFELGYFAVKLGRGRCLLRKGEVEIPSDLYGVIYADMDVAEGWKRKLAKELKAAGYMSGYARPQNCWRITAFATIAAPPPASPPPSSTPPTRPGSTWRWDAPFSWWTAPTPTPSRC